MNKKLLKIILIPIKIPIVIVCLIVSPFVTTLEYLTNPDIYDRRHYYGSWNCIFCKWLKEIILIFK